MPIHSYMHSSLAVSIGESGWLEQSDAAFTKAGEYGTGSNYVRLMEITRPRKGIIHDRNKADRLNNDELGVRITACIASDPTKRGRQDLSIALEPVAR